MRPVVYVEPRRNGRPRLVEVHLHIFGEALVTLPREPLAPRDDARRNVAASPSAHEGHAAYRVLDALSQLDRDRARDHFRDVHDHLARAGGAPTPIANSSLACSDL